MSRKKKKLMRPWESFQKVAYPVDEIKEKIKMVRESNQSEEIKEKAIQSLETLLTIDVWKNNYYEVAISRHQESPDKTVEIHLSIKRIDKKAAKDWRHFQRIKNELLGEEYEAIELYPAESRLVDVANQYHLWSIENPDGTPFIFPVGFQERLTYMGEYDSLGIYNNAKQRKHGEEN